MREKGQKKQNGGHTPGIKKMDRQNPRQAMSKAGSGNPNGTHVEMGAPASGV